MNSVKPPAKGNSEEQELEFWDRVHADAWNASDDEDAAKVR